MDDKNSQEILVINATLSQKKKLVILTTKKGTEYRIEKINDKEIRFEQVAAPGLVGRTESVTVTKK